MPVAKVRRINSASRRRSSLIEANQYWRRRSLLNRLELGDDVVMGDGNVMGGGRGH